MSDGTRLPLQWYVLRVIGGRERRVRQYLENEANRLHLEEFLPTVHVPTERVYQIRNGKKVSKERVFLPGYVLIEASLVAEVEYMLKEAPDVLGFLTDHKGDPAQLREAEVNRMLGKSVEEEVLTVPFSVGDVVRVIDGPFNTFAGTVSEVNEEKRKLTVLVKIFERKTPLELSYMQVEKE